MKALGLMSGTSFDGAIEWAVISSDGESVERCASGTFQIPNSAPFRILLQGCERAFRLANGQYAVASQQIQSDPLLPAAAKECGIQLSLEAITKLSTHHHTHAAKEALAQTKQPVDLIGYHGQTVYHAPSDGVTVQLGDGELLARSVGYRVVYDFRTQDIKAGGQGAPLAPIYHRALLASLGCLPAAWINIGGISNATFVGSDGEMLASDCGPGNALLDQFVSERSSLSFDRDGAFARAGRLDPAVCAEVLAQMKTREGELFITKVGAKSLDKSQLIIPDSARALSLEDGARSLTEATCQAIAEPIRRSNTARVVVSGGGARNIFLMELLRSMLPGVAIHSAAAFGLAVESVEAELMAYLAIRSALHLPLTFPSTTGVRIPTLGGSIASPQ